MHKKKGMVLGACFLLLLILNNCMNRQETVADDRGQDYAGSGKCISCHKEIYNSYISTAHSLTSHAASLKTIKGSFAEDSNFVQYRPLVKVVMKNTDSGLYQVAYLDNVAKQQARFDIVMGSGSKGQSYLSWLDNTLYQLPVSYFVPGNRWINSPGYPPKFVLFNRNIPVGCFECHSSYIKRTGSEPVQGYLVDHFDKSKLIYGIDCERCHGPLAAHVKYQEANPTVRTASFVTKIASLQRQQQTDLCAVCHSGAGESKLASFYYKPGSALADYMHIDKSAISAKDIDVHGKQYQLLSASQCFRKSNTLTCITCHNPHNDEKNKLQLYSQKCMTCHTNPVHTSAATGNISQEQIISNCIDCHMPARPSQAITMKSSDQNDSISAFVRTHYISVYKDAEIKYRNKR